LSALETKLSALSTGTGARVSRFSGSSGPFCASAATPGLSGGCLRGFMWALVFEVASVAMIGAVAFGIHRLHH
jgi:hypothetical protein